MDTPFSKGLLNGTDFSDERCCPCCYRILSQTPDYVLFSQLFFILYRPEDVAELLSDIYNTEWQNAADFFMYKKKFREREAAGELLKILQVRFNPNNFRPIKKMEYIKSMKTQLLSLTLCHGISTPYMFILTVNYDFTIDRIVSSFAEVFLRNISRTYLTKFLYRLKITIS